VGWDLLSTGTLLLDSSWKGPEKEVQTSMKSPLWHHILNIVHMSRLLLCYKLKLRTSYLIIPAWEVFSWCWITYSFDYKLGNPSSSCWLQKFFSCIS
jgi:hypothetical protein